MHRPHYWLSIVSLLALGFGTAACGTISVEKTELAGAPLIASIVLSTAAKTKDRGVRNVETNLIRQNRSFCHPRSSRPSRRNTRTMDIQNRHQHRKPAGKLALSGVHPYP